MADEGTLGRLGRSSAVCSPPYWMANDSASDLMNAASHTPPGGRPLPEDQGADGGNQVSRPFHRQGWVYEEKIDGWRVLAYKGAAGVCLVSRNGRDLTRRFTDLAAAVAELKPATLILDGEIAVFDRHLLSRFSGSADSRRTSPRHRRR